MWTFGLSRIKMVIRNIISTVNLSCRFRGTTKLKFSVFISLLRLQVKNKYLQSKNNIISETFLNYKIFGYDYNILFYLFKEIFIFNEYNFEPKTEEPLIIDCGSNIGMSVLYFKYKFPKSKIVAFEANPYAFSLLQKNIDINNLSNIEIFNNALFDKEQEIPFFIGNSPGTLLGSINKERGGDNKMLVKAKKLSDYLKDIQIIDLIKIDVEGAETNIINDLVDSSCLGKSKEYIIEFHHNMNENEALLSSFLKIFESNGFRYNVKATYSRINDFQDITIHFYKK